MRWISESIGAGEMRHGDAHHRTVTANAMDLFHDGDRIAEVLDHVRGHNLTKAVIGEWPGEAVKVMDHIGLCVCSEIDVDGSDQMLAPAAEIEDV